MTPIEPMGLMVAAATLLATVTVLGLIALKAWRDWIDLQRMEMEGRRDRPTPAANPAARIELADLKERVRKLEAIAAGVDL